MKDIEKLLRSAKPTVPDLPTGFENEVMLRIEALEPARTNASRSGRQVPLLLGLVMLISGALLVNSVNFSLSMSGSLDLLYFGSQFIKDVLGYLPWDLILPALIITILGAWFISRSGMFKTGTVGVVLVSFLVTSVGGTALAATGINETVQTSMLESKTRWPVLSWFYQDKARYRLNHPRFRMGQVVTVVDNQALILNPAGERISVSLPEKAVVKEGDYIRLLGKAQPTGFQASQFQHCQPRNVKRYYCHLNSENGQKGEMMRMHRMMHRKGMMD